MHRQLILILAFTGTCFFTAQSQQITERSVPAEEVEKIEQGEVAEFQKTLRRLEVAFKEGDVKSANKIKKVLEAAMQKRIDSTEKSSGDEQVAVLKKQQEILEAVQATEFSGDRENYRTELEQVRNLQQFAQLMK